MGKRQGNQALRRESRERIYKKFLIVFFEVLILGLFTGGGILFLINRMPMKSGPVMEMIKEETTQSAADNKINREPIQPDVKTEDIKKENDGPDSVEEEVLEPGVRGLETKNSGEVTMLFAGDTLFDDGYAPMVSLKNRENGIKDTFSQDLLEEMVNADIFMLNNEFTFSYQGTPLEGKMYTFRSKPDNIKYLFEMGVDIVSLANNHTFDYGEISLLDTLDTFEQADLPQVGAGRNIEEASAPVYFQGENIKIGFLAATQIERYGNPETRGATESLSGVFRCLEPMALYEAVKRTKENCDYVVVYVHWGTEKNDQPDWAQLEQSKGLAEAGADLIIGDHPHVLQGITSVGKVPVVYSLGNFWFNSFTLDTCVVKVTIDVNGLKSFQFIPAVQKNCTTSMVHGTEKERILNTLRTLSPEVNIDADGYIIF